MTTLIDFKPSAIQAFQFDATFDDALYTVLVTWNLYGQRWYINIHDIEGILVLCMPLIGSPTPKDLAAPPAFETVELMYWTDVDGGRAFFEMAAPSIAVLGDVIDVSGALNDGEAGDGAVNGQFVIDQWTDNQHFSALLTAPADAIGNITGDIILNIEASALLWSRGVVRARTALPHGLPLGTVAKITISNAVPRGYNGRYFCVINKANEFLFALPTDPGGPSTVAGSYSLDVSMTDGYFDTMLVYREFSQRFEIT